MIGIDRELVSIPRSAALASSIYAVVNEYERLDAEPRRQKPPIDLLSPSETPREERVALAIVDWMRDQAAGFAQDDHAKHVLYAIAGNIERMWRSIVMPRIEQRCAEPPRVEAQAKIIETYGETFAKLAATDASGATEGKDNG